MKISLIFLFFNLGITKHCVKNNNVKTQFANMGENLQSVFSKLQPQKNMEITAQFFVSLISQFLGVFSVK